jgi:hypothetical protein
MSRINTFIRKNLGKTEESYRRKGRDAHTSFGTEELSRLALSSFLFAARPKMAETSRRNLLDMKALYMLK